MCCHHKVREGGREGGREGIIVCVLPPQSEGGREGGREGGNNSVCVATTRVGQVRERGREGGGREGGNSASVLPPQECVR